MAQPVRIGLIGAGRWGQVYIRTFSSLADRCRLTHLCTSHPERARLAGHPVQVVPDWGALISSDCDAVVVATPPQTHAEIIEACVKAGKPCLVEKPLCLDVAAAERLEERVRVSGVPVLVDHTHLFTPSYQALKAHVRASGEPVRALLSEGMAFGPFREETPVLWDWGPHDVSLCLDFTGQAPLSVDAFGGPSGPDGEPQMVSLRLDFPGELSAWIQIGRLSPQKRRNFTVLTESRVWVLDDLAQQKLTVGPASEPLERAPVPTGPEDPPMVHVVRYFLDGLSGGDRGRFGAGLARDVVRVLARCEEALVRGRTAPGLES